MAHCTSEACSKTVAFTPVYDVRKLKCLSTGTFENQGTTVFSPVACEEQEKLQKSDIKSKKAKPSGIIYNRENEPYELVQ